MCMLPHLIMCNTRWPILLDPLVNTRFIHHQWFMIVLKCM
jgi:hypothetical protein